MKIKDESEYFVRWSSTRHLDVKQSLAFEPLLHGVFLVRAKGAMEYKEHIHSDFEIIVPISPTYKCRLNGTIVGVTAGELLFVQPGDIHQDIFFKGTEYQAFTFELRSTLVLNAGEALFKQNSNAKLRVVAFADDELKMDLVKLLSIMRTSDEPFEYYVLDGLFKAFFWKVATLFPKNAMRPFFAKSAKNEEFKNSLAHTFEGCVGETPRVSEIARKLGMSESSLAHKTKNVLDISPAQAFMNYKMNKALMLLRENTLSVKEISASLGFKDQFHFSKTFKKRFKKPPTSFR